MAQPSAQLTINKAPLDIADKALFIDHVNEEHQDELAMFIHAFTRASPSDDSVTSIVELYSDGILLTVTTSHMAQTTVSDAPYPAPQYFINFVTAIDASTSLQAQYIALLQTAATKLGKRTIKLREQCFTVLDGYYASPNMYRLVVSAPDNTPLNQAGYAYLLELNPDLSSVSPALENSESASAMSKSMTSTSVSSQQDSAEDTDSTDKAQSVQRYYTLRKAWQDSKSQSIHAWIDVYIHGSTPGGNWARSLGVGMPIKSVREYPEKLDHLNEGQCLLICDETALPTVANLLENWQNPMPPLVIAIINDAKDIRYLQDITLSTVLGDKERFIQEHLLSIVNTATTTLADQIMTTLNTRLAMSPIKIDKVWGALEAKDIKSLRPQLKSTLGLSRQDMMIKVYWRAQ